VILSIWHASFTVADMDRSIRFYRDELGLPLVHQQEYDRLTAKGVRFISEPVAVTAGINKGGATVYLEDPDGNTLEFVPAPGARA
jgi:catechol 2,3-dioxygenase-like lactoylglutathione lyase family enzyme